MKQYEYQTLKADISELANATLSSRLNELGAAGWRLVNAVPHERHGYSHDIYLMLMRETG